MLTEDMQYCISSVNTVLHCRAQQLLPVPRSLGRAARFAM